MRGIYFSFKKRLFVFAELLYSLTTKELKVRYKNTILGFLWSLLNPLLLMIVFSVVFSIIFKIGIEKYPVFLLCALFPWSFLNNSVSASTTSIVDNANLIKKVSFAREAIPLSVCLANFVHFLSALIILFIFLLIFRVHLTIFALFIPFFILIQLLFVVGISFMTSALHTRYRDVRYIMEAILLCWFYATPIFYSVSFVPNKLLNIYMLNPMACMVRAYRDILLYSRIPDLKIIAYSILSASISLTVGIFIFRRHKRQFADII